MRRTSPYNEYMKWRQYRLQGGEKDYGDWQASRDAAREICAAAEKECRDIDFERNGRECQDD